MHYHAKIMKNALKIGIWDIDFRSVKWSEYIRISDNPNIRTSTQIIMVIFGLNFNGAAVAPKTSYAF